MTLIGVVVAVIAILVLTAQESWAAGMVREREPRVPPWVTVAMVAIAVVALLPSLWKLLT